MIYLEHFGNEATGSKWFFAYGKMMVNLSILLAPGHSLEAPGSR